jgi:hypothetical protein
MILGCIPRNLGCIQMNLGCIQMNLGHIQINLGCIQINLGCIQINLGFIQINLGSISDLSWDISRDIFGIPRLGGRLELVGARLGVECSELLRSFSPGKYGKAYWWADSECVLK